MLHLLHTLLSFAVVIGVLVFVHEGGHYLAARWRGITVEVFSIGFGRELVGWTDRAGTRWRIAAIPLGGYVRMLGQSDLGIDDVPKADAPLDPGSFAAKGVGSRAIVVAAGPAFNFVFAILLFAGLYATVGRPSDRPLVASVVAGSPAAQAGFAPGDQVLSVAGVRVAHVAGVPAAVADHPGEPITVVVRRAGRDLALRATPEAVMQDGVRIGRLGIAVGATLAPVRLDPAAALVAGTRDTVAFAGQIGANLWRILRGGGGADQLGGPLRIAQVSGEAAHQGVGSLLLLIGMISVNLALVNLLPVPVLDGGWLVFFAVEAVLGRPLSVRARLLGLQAGLALIGTLFLFVTLNDLTSFGLFRWVHALAG